MYKKRAHNRNWQMGVATCTYPASGGCNKHLCSIWLVCNYWGLERTPADIANECGVCDSSVKGAMYKRGVPLRTSSHYGENHPFYNKYGNLASNWKTGHKTNTDGRGMTYLGNDGRSIYSHTSRVVAEKTLGRRLIRSEVVHHIDGDVKNDSSSNLLICTNSYHRKLHARIDAARKYGGPEIAWPDIYVKKYWDELKTQKQVALELRVSSTFVQRKMYEFGIPRRPAVA